MKSLLYFILGTIMLPYCLSASLNTPANPQEEALRQLEEAADSGMPKACFQLARLLETGKKDLVEPDSVRALALYTQAADSAYPPALNYLGYIYYNGLLGTHSNQKKGIDLIERAAMAGDMSAAANLGWLLSQKDGRVKYDTDKALYWLKKSAQSGNYLPFEAISDIYLQRGDTVVGIQYLDSAAFRGSVQAPYQLLQLREKEYTSLPSDSLINNALHYYHQGSPLMGVLLIEEILNRDDASASTGGLARAIKAQLMSQGYILKYDYDQAQSLFYDAALLGDPSAQFIVAEILDMMPDAFGETGLRNKENVEGELPTAEELRAMAAEKGVTDSRTAISRLLP